MKKLLVVALAVLVSSNAMAWGDREQGVVIGIFGTLIGQELLENHRHRHDHRDCDHYSHRHQQSSGSIADAYESGARERMETQIRFEKGRIRDYEDNLRLRAYRCGLDPQECK